MQRVKAGSEPVNSSVLWIFLIVAWLFILLPMVLRGRPEVRKTTEAAANTRLLHRGGQPAAVRRRAAGRHPSNPDYVRKSAPAAPTLKRAEIEETDVSEPKSPEKVGAEQLEIDMPEIENDEAVEDTAVNEKLIETDTDKLGAEPELEAEPAIDAEAESDAETESDAEVTDVIDVVSEDVVVDEDIVEEDLEADAEAETDTDAEDELGDLFEDEDLPARRTPVSRERRGRGYDADELAERDARRYRERQRMVLGLGAATAVSIAACIFWQPYGFIMLGVMVVLTGLYLFFLRRTAIAEQEYRATRAARLRRHAAEDERLERQQAEQLAARPVAPGRRRPGGMVVLDFDDEDPAFDHLPTYDLAAAMAATDGLDDGYRRAV